MHFDNPLVSHAFLPVYQAQFFTAGYQGHHPVMMGLQQLCQFAYGGPLPPLKALDMQQHQILQVGHAEIARHFLAETKKSAQLIAEM